MTNLSGVIQYLNKERERLTKQVDAITAALTAFGAVYKNGTGARRPLSAAARARIAAAQRARWAKSRTSNGQKNVVAMPKKRTLSAAARKKIAAAQRERWAKVKAQKKAA
jgi:hypothetical protein